MIGRKLSSAILTVFLFSFVAAAQQRIAFDEQLQRVFGRNEYAAKNFGATAWWEEGKRFTTIEKSEIIAYDTSSGKREALISADILKPQGAKEPLVINSYSWSNDRAHLLIFTNSKKVWRDNTRGDYWV